MEATLYKTNGEQKKVTPKNGTDFSLRELQDFVGGYIQCCYFPNDNRVMVINEEGKLDNLPINRQATEIYQKEIYRGDYIVGDALVCDGDMIK